MSDGRETNDERRTTAAGRWSLVGGRWSLVVRPLFFILLAALLLFVGILWRTPPLTVDVGAPGDIRYIAGFYPVEQVEERTFRWSGPDARLVLYGTGSSPALLRLHIHSNQPDASDPNYIHVQQDEQELSSFSVASGWRIYHILLPTGASAETGFAPVSLALVTTRDRFQNRPYQPPSDDERELGVPLDWFQVQPVAGLPASPKIPLQRGLLLVWGLAVLAGVLWPLNAALDPGREPAQAVMHLCVQLGGAALLLALWAWRDPFLLAWAWSLSPQGLTMATALLFSAAVLRPGSDRALRQTLRFIRSRSLDSTRSIAFRSNWSRLVQRCVTLLLPLLVLLLLAHALLIAPVPLALQATAAWLIVGLPGALLSLILFRDETDSLALLFLSICSGIALPSLLLLPLQALPGAVPWWSLLLLSDLLSLLCLFAPSPLRPFAPSPLRPFALPPLRLLTASILLLATFFRFASLGRAEFQGDEGQPMLMANYMLYGVDTILLLHRKGPLEVLLPAVPLVLTGHINEWGARLPFAISGVAAILGIYALARRLFSSAPVGVLAVFILALDGFMIAFSRIVQYQNVVITMTIAGLWCAWRFYEGGPRRYLVLVALFAAVSLLGHYDGIFGLPALAWLVLAGGLRRGWRRPKQWVQSVLPPAVVVCGLLGSFYLPFVLHENFTRTADYLVNMRIGERDTAGTTLNNLVDYFQLMTFYNTLYHVTALAIMLALCLIVWILVYSRPPILGWPLAALLLTGCGVLTWEPARFQLDNGFNWAIVAFGLPLAGLVLASATPLALRTALLWFGFPFIAESFLIASPNTHFYTMHTAAAMLIAAGLVQLAGWLRQRHILWTLSPLVFAGSVLLVLTLHYLHLIFVQSYPEYQRTFPQARPNIYLATYGDRLPTGGYFGFPHNDGWKVIGELYRQGVLKGTYDSNQKSLVTVWYIRDGIRGGEPPDYYFAARQEPYLFVPKNYHLYGSVLVNGNPMLDIYSRTPLTNPPQIFHLHDYERSFDALPVPALPLHLQFLEIDTRKARDPGALYHPQTQELSGDHYGIP